MQDDIDSMARLGPGYLCVQYFTPAPPSSPLSFQAEASLRKKYTKVILLILRNISAFFLVFLSVFKTEQLGFRYHCFLYSKSYNTYGGQCTVH